MAARTGTEGGPQQPVKPKWPRFNRAPITEALLDIRAKSADGLVFTDFLKFQEAIMEQYPRRAERVSVQAGFQISPDGGVEVVPPSAKPDGYLFTSKDGLRVLQARLDGFSFSRLRPYESWEDLRDEARGLFQKYIEIARPQSVSRIALRYINRIELPTDGGVVNSKEYVVTGPEIASKLPQALAAFFLRLVIPYESFKCTAIVTETTEPPTGRAIPFVFDIDVFREQSFSLDDPALWIAFEELRDAKNEIFFGSVTKKAEALFT